MIHGSSGPDSLTFEVAAEGPPTGASRRFLAVGPGGFLSPDSVTPRAADTLLDPANEADYLIIELARHKLGEDWLQDYVAKVNQGGIERVLL